MKTLTDEECGFIVTKKLDGQGEIAIMRMAFTVALCCHISRHPLDMAYQYRYCYENYADCLRDFEEWDGIGHPNGDWIKQKGINGDISNPKLEKDYAEEPI